MALLSRFFGRAASEGAAFALGTAVGPVLRPAVQELLNEAWATYPTRPVDPALLAQGVAQGQIAHGAAASIAAHTGISEANFDHMVAIFDTGPGVAVAFELWRRGVIDEAAFRRALKREGLENEWINDLVSIKRVLLSAAELANAVVQGHRDLDAAADDAVKLGYTRADFQTMVDNTGLPPGPETLLAWLRRGIITTDEFEQGIREGHTKVKYIGPYEDALHPVLTAAEYAGLHLRGWISEAEMNAGGSLTGFTPEQMQQLYLNRGRPATTHQIHIGYQRGGRIQGANLSERETFSRSVKQSNIRPEYEDILWAQRYTLPPFFALRALMQGGVIDQARAEGLLIDSGWPPDLAHDVSEFYSHPAVVASTNPRVKRAQDQVYNATHKSYLDGEIDQATASATLERVGLSAALAGQVVDLWDIENGVLVKPLTAAQIKKAFKNNALSVDEATARLVAQQWTTADAQLYLQS